jgi:hypothetical protein
MNSDAHKNVDNRSLAVQVECVAHDLDIRSVDDFRYTKERKSGPALRYCEKVGGGAETVLAPDEVGKTAPAPRKLRTEDLIGSPWFPTLVQRLRRGTTTP